MDQFEPNRPGEIQGDVTSVVVIDPAAPAPPNAGNLVVDPTKDFQIKVDWALTGTDVPLWLNGRTSNWNVQAYAESIGGGFEGLIARDDSVAADPGNPNYSTTLTVPAFKLDEGNPGSDVSGLYKLAVAVFLNSDLPGAGFDMIGFREGPIIQVEDPR
jgi:hypothetical protein